MKKIILIPPNFQHGDSFSVIGLIYFLLEYYEEVYFLINPPEIINYYNCYFHHDKNFNKRIFIIDIFNLKNKINNGNYGEYHLINTNTDDWFHARFHFYELDNLDKNYYFNDLHPIYKKLNIEQKYIEFPNRHLPNKIITINHLIYYNLIGLNNNVRMNFFHYERNLESEINIKNNILFNLNVKGKYNIVNDPIGKIDELKKCIKNDFPIININFLSVCPGNLIKLVEDAESVHFIESVNTNFFYHCQYKNIFKYDKKINFHIWLRNRNWAYQDACVSNVENMNLDYAWKMMDTPRLDNWNFIFNEKDA